MQNIQPIFKINSQGHKYYESFLTILDRRACDIHCPYCTAKITNWDEGDDKLESLESYLRNFKEGNISFENLAISGNGEPSLYPYRILHQLSETIRPFSSLFKYKRFQSSGNIFHHPEKHSSFADYTFELTRASLNNERDMQIKGYTRDYTATELFKKSKIGIEHCLLKENYPDLINDIEGYVNAYRSQITTINLKILNLNTKDGAINNPWSQWILKNGVAASESEKIIELISRYFPQQGGYDEIFDRYTWMVGDIPLIFCIKKNTYGLSHISFNKGKLITYQLDEINLRGKQ